MAPTGAAAPGKRERARRSQFELIGFAESGQETWPKPTRGKPKYPTVKLAPRPKFFRAKEGEKRGRE